MLNEHFSFLFAHDVGELVFISAFLVVALEVRLSACLLEQVGATQFLSTQKQVERRSNLTEWHRLHLHGSFGNVINLQVSHFDRLFLATARENHHSLQLLNVGFFEIIVLEKVYQETLDSFEVVIGFEVLTLEEQDWFHVCVHVLGGLKRARSLKVLHSELADVKDMAIENAPKYKIIRTFLLMTAHSKETAIVLDRLILNQTGILHGYDVMSVSHKHLHSLTTLHQLQVFEQFVDCGA